MNFLKNSILPFSLVALSACNTITQPISNASFDPLKAPGSTVTKKDTKDYSSTLKLSPGQFVSANVPNTAFYNNKPKASQNADKLLKKGTQMKVVSVFKNTAKVELDSGDVGYVPTVMLSLSESDAQPNTDSDSDSTQRTEKSLPQHSSEPLPVIDPDGLPPEDAIPTIIDPDAPSDIFVPPVLDDLPEVPTPELESIPEPTAPSIESIPEPTAPSIESIAPSLEDTVAPALTQAEEGLDPVAESVRKKVEAALKEDQIKAAAE